MVAWRSVDDTTGDSTEDLFRLRRQRDLDHAVVLVLAKHGAYYFTSGLCSMPRDNPASSVGPHSTITAATEPWLFEMTSFLADDGYIDRVLAGSRTMSPRIVVGVKAFQKAKGLKVDGWIGPDTIAAATKTACSAAPATL